MLCEKLLQFSIFLVQLDQFLLVVMLCICVTVEMTNNIEDLAHKQELLYLDDLDDKRPGVL